MAKKEREKNDLKLTKSFTEVQDAYEMITHSLQCTALVSGMKKNHFKLQIDTVSSENLRLQLDSCQIWVYLKKVICIQLLT
jgi:hypothetical protein